MCFLLFTRIYVGWFVRGLLHKRINSKNPRNEGGVCFFSFTRIYVTWLMRNLLTQRKTIKAWNRSICVTKTECVFFYYSRVYMLVGLYGTSCTNKSIVKIHVAKAGCVFYSRIYIYICWFVRDFLTKLKTLQA